MELENVFNNFKIKNYLDQKNNPWFKGKDVATILGYKDTDQALRKNVDEDEKTSSIYINESGVYSLVLKYKMKEAKLFKKWVTSEVLHFIRKKGEQNNIKQLSIEFEQKLSIIHSRI
jgi:prophage antirepressor-like protein